MIKIIQAFLIFLGVQVLFEGIRRFCGDLSPIYADALADVVIIVLFVVLKLFHFSTDFFKQKPYTILAFCGVLAVSTITPSMKLQEFMPELPNVAEKLLGQFMQSFAGYVVIGLSTPIVEEIVFRGIILKSLLRMKKLQGKIGSRGGIFPFTRVVSTSWSKMACLRIRQGSGLRIRRFTELQRPKQIFMSA